MRLSKLSLILIVTLFQSMGHADIVASGDIGEPSYSQNLQATQFQIPSTDALSYFDEFTQAVKRLRVGKDVVRSPRAILLEAEQKGISREAILNAGAENGRVSPEAVKVAWTTAQKISIGMSCAAIAINVLILLNSCSIH